METAAQMMQEKRLVAAAVADCSSDLVVVAADRVSLVVADKAMTVDYDKESLDLYWDSWMSCNPTLGKQAVCTVQNF